MGQGRTFLAFLAALFSDRSIRRAIFASLVVICLVDSHFLRAAAQKPGSEIGSDDLDDEDSFDEDLEDFEDDGLGDDDAKAHGGHGSVRDKDRGASGTVKDKAGKDSTVKTDKTAGKDSNKGSASTGAKSSRDNVPLEGAAEDDDDVLYDEDEFVGVPAHDAMSNPSPGSAGRGNAAKPKVTFGPVQKESYIYEYLAIAFIVIYAINYFVGKRNNDKIARKWYETFNQFFTQQFYALGEQDDNNTHLLKDSPALYRFYASGRRHCTGILATLEMKRRQDIFSMLLALVDLSTTQDTVTIEIPMDEEMEPFVFAVVKKRLERRLRKSQRDLENFTGSLKSSRVPSTLSIMTDCPELELDLFDDKVLSVVQKAESLFQFIHLTDQNSSGFGGQFSVDQWKKMLRFKFALPAADEMDKLDGLTKMAIHYIDRVAVTKLSAQARTRSVNKRKLVAEKMFRQSHSQRQEALARRKEDMKRREEENTADLTPEQKRKREEKEHRAQLKRTKQKVKIIR